MIDEIIQEEALELNKIEALRETSKPTTLLADRSMLGKFHDYKNVDLRDIQQIFEEYN